MPDALDTRDYNDTRSSERWWDCSPEEGAKHVRAMAKAFADGQIGRLSRHRVNLEHYEGHTSAGLFEGIYGQGSSSQQTTEDMIWKVPRNIIQALTARIAGRQRPRPMFQTSGADYKLRRRAKKLDKFVEAMMHVEQPPYDNSWELMLALFVDALIWGTGAAKIYPDLDAEKVTVERVFTHEMFVDYHEARYGTPVNLVHTYWANKDHIAELYPDHAEQILASNPPDDEPQETAIHSRMLEISEAWRLPISKDKPGKWCMTIDGVDEPLEWEDYTRDCFPFLFVRWNRQIAGFWGQGVPEEIEEIVDELQDVIQRVQDNVRLNAGAVVAYNSQIVEEEDISSNDSGAMIPVDGPVGGSIDFKVPPSFGSDVMQYIMMLRDQAYEQEGLSQLSATGRKPSGVDAAVAMRTLNDLETERFSVAAKNYEQAYVQLGKHMIHCAREIAKETKGKWSVTWPGKDFLKEIKWSDVSLEDDQFHVQVYPVSDLPSTPAGRLSFLTELVSSGMISMEAGRRLYFDGTNDLEAFGSRVNAQREYLEELIDRLLDADEDDFDPDDYDPPEGGLLDLAAAVTQVGEAYFEAKRHGAPEFNLELLRRYMKDINRLVERAMQTVGPAPAGAAAPVGPPPDEVAQPIPGAAPTAGVAGPPAAQGMPTDLPSIPAP